jgi:hypothetical protein
VATAPRKKHADTAQALQDPAASSATSGRTARSSPKFTKTVTIARRRIARSRR